MQDVDALAALRAAIEACEKALVVTERTSRPVAKVAIGMAIRDLQDAVDEQTGQPLHS